MKYRRALVHWLAAVLAAAVLAGPAPPPTAGAGPAAAAAQASGGSQAGASGGVAAAPAVQAGPPPGPVAEPTVRARAALLADEATGQVLFERASRTPRAMASTTKVMTALLALERVDPDRVVAIGAAPPRVGEESLRLRQGERLTVRQLLLGLLVKSANDAAVALADAVDGGEAAFVRHMNRKAAALRLSATHYVTPYGLDRPGHRTSARDLAALWEVAMRRADFRGLVATRTARLPGGPVGLRRFPTTVALLTSYRWTVGGKTGFTNRAGRCLVASASRGGRRLVAVALGSPDAAADVRALFEYGFSAFVRARLAAPGQPVATAGPARPPAWRAAAGVDALVRRDQLGRLTLAVGAANGARPPSAWLMAGRARLAPVALERLPAAGPAGGLPPPVTAPPSTAPAAAAGSTLVAGAAVRVGPAPAVARPTAIDPLLQREPA